MKFRLGLSISPYTKAKMPTIVLSPSPIPMPRSASARPSPVYSQKLPSQRPSPVYSQRPPLPTQRPHIMPIRKADMIPSYSASSTSSPLVLAEVHSHSLLISSLQAVGGFGVLIFFAIILWAIRIEMSKTKVKARKEGFTHIDYSQQINPTAYNKLNLIRRASSNSLSSSGNISPV